MALIYLGAAVYYPKIKEHMNPSNFSVELDGRLDKNDKLYYLGKKKFPGIIDFSQGLTLLAFVSEDGDEEIQIAINDKENSSFSKVKKERVDKHRTRLKIPVEPRTDQYDKTFYVCKVNANLIVDCYDEVVFLLYTSKKGNEEIQIVGNVIEVEPVEKENKVHHIEIIHKARRRDY